MLLRHPQVYVQQANSVFAGVTHPKATSHRHGEQQGRAAGDASPGDTGSASAPCKHTACSGVAHLRRGEDAIAAVAAAGGIWGEITGTDKGGEGGGGGPSAFSEIQEANYYGTSHFPCCITNVRYKRTHAHAHAHETPSGVHMLNASICFGCVGVALFCLRSVRVGGL